MVLMAVAGTQRGCGLRVLLLTGQHAQRGQRPAAGPLHVGHQLRCQPGAERGHTRAVCSGRHAGLRWSMQGMSEWYFISSECGILWMFVKYRDLDGRCEEHAMHGNLGESRVLGSLPNPNCALHDGLEVKAGVRHVITWGVICFDGRQP